MNESTRSYCISRGSSSLSASRESGFQIDPSLKVQINTFSIKWKRIEKLSKQHSCIVLCDIARMSLSGYYAWRKRIREKVTHEDREEESKKQIEQMVVKHHRKYGYRMITMKLMQAWIVWNNGKQMNHKKVHRIMRKYHLLAKVRRYNPYKQIQKATREHSIAPNLVNREFWWLLPYTRLGTDITYLRLNGRWSYLSMIKDMASGEILSHALSQNLELTVVQRTLERLEDACQNQELIWAYLHSDQWFHYTHPSFSARLKKMGCIQSMSRKWNCIDNSPTESFFGHMKDELDIRNCTTFSELEKVIDIYMIYYNNERPQWNKKKMTPVQYRNHLLGTQSKKQKQTETNINN